MLGESHILMEELPEYRERILELTDTDSKFAHLAGHYHKVNSEVIRIEQAIETASDFYTEELKKRRLALKDRLYDYLRHIN